MNKVFIVFIALFSAFVAAENIVLSVSRHGTLSQTVRANARIVQLSDVSQYVTSPLEGHLERYDVTPGKRVRKGDAVARIRSLELSRMSAEYIALRAQTRAARARLASVETLVAKGLASQNELNAQRIALQELQARRDTLATQLRAVGIAYETLENPTDMLILRAHDDGVAGELLVGLHSNVERNTPLVRIISPDAFYAEVYLSPKDAMRLDKDKPGRLYLGDMTLPMKFAYLSPQTDLLTQRIKALYRIETKGLLPLDTYVQTDVALQSKQEATRIAASALTMLNGAWVVFVPQNDEAHAASNASQTHHDETKEEGYDEHSGEHTDEHDEDEHEAPYRPVAVRILEQNATDALVLGLAPGTPYVAVGVYDVKSSLLRGALGEHGH
jgi:multidrug efflux pump subunit AcrA (membrane-fusion protein)